MNMRFVKPSLAALFGLAIAGQAHAAQFFLSTSPTLTAVTAPAAAALTNPTLILPDTSSVGHLYLWVKLAPSTVADGTPTENVNSMGLDVVQEGGGGQAAAAHATTYNVFGMTGNPAATRRWDVPAPTTVATPMTGAGESVGSPTLAVFRRAAVSTVGLQDPAAAGDHDLANSPVDATGNIYERVADISLIGDAATDAVKNPLGIPLFIRSNTQTVNYDGTLPNHGPNTFFGAGDAAVNATNGNGGVQSANPDGFLVVVGGGATPEPGSMALLSLGALGLIRRRKA